MYIRLETKYNERTGLWELWEYHINPSDAIYPVTHAWLIDVSEENNFKQESWKNK